MNFRTVKSLRDGIYTVRFETGFTTSEEDLIDAFGDPTVSLGGSFWGHTITFTGSIQKNEVIRKGSAIANYFKTNMIRRYNANAFTTGGITSQLATITAVGLISFSLAAENAHLQDDFPHTESFLSENSAEIYADTIKYRANVALATLVGETDDFSADSSEKM